METLDCAVIGAGAVGLAIARRLALAGREVVVLEAEGSIGNHTSSRNSEVIHAGIYYPTGSLRARLCVAGKEALYRYCPERGVEHRRISKAIVATAEDEIPTLRRYKEQAERNGVLDLTWLTRDDMAALEPNVLAVAGLLSPSTGIIDSHGLMLAYLGDAEAHGASIAFHSRVLGGATCSDGIVLRVGERDPLTVKCNLVINAAGLCAPAVAHSIHGIAAATIPPQHFCKGHYYVLAGRSPFGRLIYPVGSGLWHGVHVTLDLGGQVKFGPDLEWLESIDYRFDTSRAGSFYESIRHYYPALPDGALQPGYTGIRPKITAKGEPAADFMIQGPREHGAPGLVNLYGIESPGLTSSMAIGDYVADLLGLV
ncbi:MAG: NAD(P)/FAD-dependent oxidoreductase [Burkholderiales bacterium]|nr:NAD(P)/FAD-dependent oxidoreductase [Burkholderiales bacterium]